MQKRVRVIGGLRNKTFKYFAVGKRHLNRNKSNLNLRHKRRVHVLTKRGDIKHAKFLLPYFRRNKFLKS